MPMPQGCNIDDVLTSFRDDIENVLADAVEKKLDPDAIHELEKTLCEKTRQLSDGIMATFIRFLLACTALDRMTVRAFKACAIHHYKDEGKRDVKIHFAGGGVYAFKATYLRRCKKRQRGRPKNHGNRGEFGKGVFPVLEILGIHFVHSKMKASPVFEERIIFAMTASDSHGAARKLLEKWGISMNCQPLQNFFESSGKRYREQRDGWLFFQSDDGPIDPDDFKGRRVVVSTDGGRSRLRKNKPGRPRDSGYHGFDAEWKEPKLFCIYVIDDTGKRLRSVRALIDGVMVDDDETVGANRLFEQLEAYLRAIGIDRAAEVIFTADGAPWIWQRARPMLIRLGVAEAKITEVLDWFHAAQAVCKLSELPADWPPARRIRWRNKTKKALHAGRIDQVIAFVDQLADAPGAEDARKKRKFFARNRERMDYQNLAERKIPRGSGAVESAVRRVINQRIKSNAKFWYRENVETMLFWRGYLKTDRLNDLCGWSRRFRARWWTASAQRHTQTMLKAA